MSASTRHPAFDLFNHWWVPGGIQTLVLREYESDPIKTPNPGLLAAFYESRNCKEAAKLIEYIDSCPGLSQIGSGTVDVGAILGLPPEKDFHALQELYVGSMNPRILPLEWLGYLARAFEEIPESLRPVFDGYCGAIVSMVSTPAVPLSWDELDPPDERPRRSLREIMEELRADACSNMRKLS
jgi:hypothetical protein